MVSRGWLFLFCIENGKRQYGALKNGSSKKIRDCAKLGGGRRTKKAPGNRGSEVLKTLFGLSYDRWAIL
ncbi:hypothetical protein ACFL35_04255 [Candidatus Riflebacteria bacterium]